MTNSINDSNHFTTSDELTNGSWRVTCDACDWTFETNDETAAMNAGVAHEDEANESH